MKKVAIVAYSLTTRKQAPFFDVNFEVWGLNWLFYKIPRADRWFEMHYSRVKDIEPERYLDWLKTQKEIPVYMQHKFGAIPASVKYPKNEVIQEFGAFFNCSMDWMLALAIYENYKEIHLYGCEMARGSRYEYQRESFSWWCGIAYGRRIKLYIPEESDLLKTEILYGYNERINS